MRTNATGVARVLAHPVRYRVLEAIAQAPCSTQEEIAKGLGLPVETVSVHVRALAAYEAVGTCQGAGLTADMDAARAALDSEFGGEMRD